MKYLIIVVCFTTAIIAGSRVGSQSQTQLQQLKQMQLQLQQIQRSDDAINAQLQEVLLLGNNPTPKPAAVTPPAVRGRASVYTEAGCLGCDSQRIMANGEKLDDDRATVALACRWSAGHCYLALNLGSSVMVRNTETGRATAATITDTFDGIYGRVADLSQATAQAIGCDGLCMVTISK